MNFREVQSEILTSRPLIKPRLTINQSFVELGKRLNREGLIQKFLEVIQRTKYPVGGGPGAENSKQFKRQKIHLSKPLKIEPRLFFLALDETLTSIFFFIYSVFDFPTTLKQVVHTNQHHFLLGEIVETENTGGISYEGSNILNSARQLRIECFVSSHSEHVISPIQMSLYSLAHSTRAFVERAFHNSSLV